MYKSECGRKRDIEGSWILRGAEQRLSSDEGELQ